MGAPPATGLVRMLLWCLAAGMTVVALARPQWGAVPQERSIRTRDLIIALDLSDSMLCPDLPPSRLERVMTELRQLLPKLLGNRVGVVVFAGEAYPLVPLTTDLEAVLAFLSSVEPAMIGSPGSNLEQAVSVSLDLLPEEGQGRVVVLISDGENRQGNPEAAAERLERSGVRLLALVAGAAAGGPIPVPHKDGSLRYKLAANGQPVITRARRDLLKTLADAGHGELIDLAAAHASRRLLTSVNRLRTREQTMTQPAQRQERFPLVLLTAVVMVTAGFAVPCWRRRVLVPPLLILLALLPGCAPGLVGADDRQAPVAAGPTPTGPTPTGPALLNQGPEPTWWQRLIPGGSRRMARSGLVSWQRSEHQTAVQHLTIAAKLDPTSRHRWYDLGTALAASGNPEAALPILREAYERGAADAAFNLGTTALLQGRSELAVVWLRRALLADPDAADVRLNYELALQLQTARQSSNDGQLHQPSADEQAPAPQPVVVKSPQIPSQLTTEAIYSALQRSENQARAALRSSQARPAPVNEDW